MKHLASIVLLFLFMSLIYMLYVSKAFIYFVSDHQIVKLALKDNFFAPAQKKLLVEVVNREPSTAQGLSDRTDLLTVDGQPLDGMLFVFPSKGIRHFWMKDMFFDIDICFMNDTRFLSCTRNVQPPISAGQSNLDMPIYKSEAKSNIVLETKQGFLTETDLDSKLFFMW